MIEFDSLLTDTVVRLTPVEEVIEEAAWREIERKGWVPTPELLFALKDVIREQMLGG